MFKVMDKHHKQEIFTVYSIDRLSDRDSYFLIYDGYKWDWVHSSYFAPVDEGHDGLCISGDGRTVEVMTSSQPPSCNVLDDILDKAKPYSEGILHLIFDDSPNDIACLVVSTITNDAIHVIKIFHDKEAREIYKKLTEKDGNKNE